MKKAIRPLLLLAFVWLSGQDLRAGSLEVSERSWDFGRVPPRAKVTHAFSIKNSGRDSLRLVKVRFTCSCTSAPLKKQVLAPGDATQLEVTFNSGSFSGPVSRVLYLQSDDPAEPMLELGVSATVGFRGRQLEFDPPWADFDTVPALPARVSLRMKNRDSVPVALLEKTEVIEVELPAEPVPTGSETVIEIEMKALLPGGFEESFTLVCSNPQKSRYTIPVRGFYKPGK